MFKYIIRKLKLELGFSNFLRSLLGMMVQVFVLLQGKLVLMRRMKKLG
jgi:hypothetical protein